MRQEKKKKALIFRIKNVKNMFHSDLQQLCLKCVAGDSCSTLRDKSVYCLDQSPSQRTAQTRPFLVCPPWLFFFFPVRSCRRGRGHRWVLCQPKLENGFIANWDLWNTPGAALQTESLKTSFISQNFLWACVDECHFKLLKLWQHKEIPSS